MNERIHSRIPNDPPLRYAGTPLHLSCTGPRYRKRMVFLLQVVFLVSRQDDPTSGACLWPSASRPADGLQLRQKLLQVKL